MDDIFFWWWEGEFIGPLRPYLLTTKLPSFSIQCQISPIGTTSHLFNILFYNIFLAHSRSSQRSLPTGFCSITACSSVFLFLHARPTPLSLLLLITFIISEVPYNVSSSIFFLCLHSPVISSLSRPYISRNTFLSKTMNLYSSIFLSGHVISVQYNWSYQARI